MFFTFKDHKAQKATHLPAKERWQFFQLVQRHRVSLVKGRATVAFGAAVRPVVDSAASSVDCVAA